jgi:general secretion pathway protein G
MGRAGGRWIWLLSRSATIVVGVLVLLGLIATLVVPRVLEQSGRTHCSKIGMDFRAIDAALDEYAVAHGGRFPDSLWDLVTPDADGRTYLDATRVPRDPWDREYIYGAPRPGQPRPIVKSYGKDGRLGGEGDDADIDNLSLRAER